MSYADVIWSSCDKEHFTESWNNRSVHLESLYMPTAQHPLWHFLISWDGYLFMNRVKLTNVLFFNKCVNGSLPNTLLNEHLTINNTQHNRSTRYASHNSICPYYIPETEGGSSFAVSLTRLWNNVPLNMRKLDSVKSLKTHLFKTIFAAQQHLDHV